jgi:NAD(P)-dependent dehydrogenase (short-subunit alcohol dehydrogenase family)
MFSLQGKTALITGGGRGIGKAIARGMAEAGADVAVASRRLPNCLETAEELKKYGGRTLALQADMAKMEEIGPLVEKVVESWGRIDILVNNAGVTWGAPTLEYPYDKWDKVMAVNVRGLFFLSQKVAKGMIAGGGGKIINITSVMGFVGAAEEIAPAVAYNASKGAVITLTKDLAVKWAKHNIQVNAIAPGFFGTDMMAWTNNPAFAHARERLIEIIPMGRIGGEEDIKGVAVFLASPAANYITGEIIRVDGGQLAH